LHTAVETLVRIERHQRTVLEDQDIDLSSVKGVRDALSREPCLLWAAPYAQRCFQLLRKRVFTDALGAGSSDFPLLGSASMGALCGAPGRLPPMGGGGWGCGAIRLEPSRSCQKLSGARAAKLAGVDRSVASALAWRLRQLSADRGACAAIQLVVETCRCCTSHFNLRHTEETYLTRFRRLKRAVESISKVIHVELLVPRDICKGKSSCGARADVPRGCAGKGSSDPEWMPAVRIAAFEVFLCCSEPLIPFGAIALPNLSPPGERNPSPAISALCVFSKLSTRDFPATDVVLRQLVTALPRVALRISVRTPKDLPVPGVSVVVKDTLAHAACLQLTGKTDAEGFCRLFVPTGVTMCLRASHEILMDVQERLVEIGLSAQSELFVTEFVAQLWQDIQSNKLIVYMSSPRANPAPTVAERYLPFQGQLELVSGEQVRPDSGGYLRGHANFVADVKQVSCRGWRSAPCTQFHASGHGTGSPIEIARLSAAGIEACIVAPCCGAGVPGAFVRVDGDTVGATDASGTVGYDIKHGDHSLHVEHLLADDLTLSMNKASYEKGRAQIMLTPKPLYFVCAEPGGGATRGSDRFSFADLWVVVGSLDEWRAPTDGRVWSWDGVLLGGGCALEVCEGRLNNFEPDLLIASSSCGNCPLSRSLALPESRDERWPVVLRLPDCPGCILDRLTSTLHGGCKVPALWIARLAARESYMECALPSLLPEMHHTHMVLRTTCCGSAYATAEVATPLGVAQNCSDDGSFELPCVPEGGLQLHIDGVPACLLPGSSCDFIIPEGRSQARKVDIEVSCLLWIYWVLIEDEESDAGVVDTIDAASGGEMAGTATADGADATQDDEVADAGCVWVAVNAEHVPDDARPISGVLRCPMACAAETVLGGHELGPFSLRVGSGIQAGGLPSCLLATVSFDIVAPDGFEYRARDPSVLFERCEELGGCELERLANCPATLGFLKRVTQPGAPFSD